MCAQNLYENGEDSLFAKNVKEEFKMICDTFKGSNER